MQIVSMMAFILIFVCSPHVYVAADGLAHNPYEALLEANQVDSKTTEKRISLFKQVINGITNFPDLREAFKSFMAHTPVKEKKLIRDMFADKEDKLQIAIRKRALDAGATWKAATDIAQLARENRLNKEIKFGITYLTEVITCQNRALQEEGSYCTKNFVEDYDVLNIVKILIANGADVNKREQLFTDTGDKINNRTPLMLAAEINDPDLVQLLLAHGARAGDKTFKGYTALDIARSNNVGGRSNRVMALLRGANGGKQ